MAARYAIPAVSSCFPLLGFALTDGGAPDWRVGWRLTSAAPGDPGFEVNLDATRRDLPTPDQAAVARCAA